MENNENTNQVEDTSSWSFVSEEEVAASMQQPTPEPTQEAVNEQPQEQQAEPQTESQAEPRVQQETSEPYNDGGMFNASTDDYVDDNSNNDFSDDYLEQSILGYLSERLGREFGSFDDLLTNNQQQQSDLDERIATIAKFVEETGRSPEDWFMYQRLNPSEMDDMTAIQVQMASDYPSLSMDEIQMLVGSKYKLNPDVNTEEEISLSKLQLKIDAEKARTGIDDMRSQYKAPQVDQYQDTDLFDENWVSSMRQELNSLDGIEFDLGNGKNFTFGLGDKYKSNLAEKNAHLDEYFDPYVDSNGRWDFDKLNMHRAVVDNIETIVKSVYQQGMSDGQRNIVNKAANVSTKSPSQGSMQQPQDSLSAQLREALGGRSGLTFNV